MATIGQLIERLETRLQLASGLDTQILYENKIVEMIRSTYNGLFDEFWFPDYTLYATFDLQADGLVSEDLTNVIRRYDDIHSIYYDEEDKPLPRLLPGTNPNRLRTRCVVPHGDPAKLFRVFPLDEPAPLHVWYRTRIPDSVWESGNYDEVINMDDEVILHGVMFDFTTSDGSNAEDARKYLMKFEERKKQLKANQWNLGINKRDLSQDGPLNRWT
jgi:hypothetical protein